MLLLKELSVLDISELSLSYPGILLFLERITINLCQQKGMK